MFCVDCKISGHSQLSCPKKAEHKIAKLLEQQVNGAALEARERNARSRISQERDRAESTKQTVEAKRQTKIAQERAKKEEESRKRIEALQVEQTAESKRLRKIAEKAARKEQELRELREEREREEADQQSDAARKLGEWQRTLAQVVRAIDVDPACACVGVEYCTTPPSARSSVPS